MRLTIPRSARWAALAAACAMFPLPSPASAADAADRSSFLLPMLPDTQFYSRYATAETGELFMTRYDSEPYAAQTQWLVDNKDRLEIPFVAHLGDIVDQHGKTQEWEVAKDAMRILEDGDLDYSILAGNHDVANGCYGTSCHDDRRTLANERYLSAFPTSRAAQQSSFRGRHSSGFHEWHTFTAEGRTFLMLAMSWSASDDAIAWARRVIADNPTLPVILTTHEILGVAGDGVTATETTQGLRLWNQLIRDNDQIFLTVSGHNHGAAHLRKTNDFGHSVDQILLDYQMAYMGGNGYLGLFEFDFTNDKLDTTVVSPWVKLKPAETLIADYDVVVRPGANENLSLPIDWDARFGGFEGTPGALSPAHPSLLEAAKVAARDGFVDPEVRAPAAPHDGDDYPKVDGTLAHWRFGAGSGSPVAVGSGVEDVAGDNDLRRVPLDSDGIVGAQLGDVTHVADHPFLSADSGAMCFDNTTKSPMRLSYLSTAANAPVNSASFPNGYTIESFVKIDADWTSGGNAWMGALTRDGKRGEVTGFPIPGSDSDEPAFTLAVSSLREIQWNASVVTPLAERTNWSGEVMPDKWLHVVAVNDPITATTTLYIDGAPVLRNAINGVGLGTANKPWRIGSSTWAGETADGWLGCIGETRIVDHVLPREQWLTARTYVAPEEPGTREPETREPETREPETGGGTTTPPADGGTTTPPAATPLPGGDTAVPPVATPAAPAAAAPRTPGATARAPRIAAIAVAGQRLRIRLGGAAKVRVALRACPVGAKACARRPARTFTLTAKRAGTVTVRLPRALRAGRYRVEVTATAGGRTSRRGATVRVAARR
ncbi:LamG-like jellyroll fold domain-containing protein [Conexibacter stalactiti]|uniref:LamG-like jellyroll fold domain-containing protein n=1 Tax=Conexibacter stalactiti TaxID=1940611 RepID=A0ABU4HYE9_9ACTN|nr:LamG-like jellyroll fold domain-containing protein [Conexibacter stalactiti]MDW5598347.1 LamG-like jellyroll fold domain-containing protein [Conexibacter stalactiti]MEC5038989.1 LamG-like jellyroll fold domain-containing protein [Conexibacter stalactiti]